ncbi:MAG: extracellular solute-binding protein [Acidimicrobiales bacterium]|nr:extracellular solute-binding protein [Acidimicrobiales bacterium]
MASRAAFRRGWSLQAILAFLLVALVASSCTSGERGRPTGEAGTGGDAAALPPCPLEALDEAVARNGGKPVEVVIWHFLQAKTRESLERLVNEYNASQTRVRVRAENQGSSNDELWDKYRAGIRTKALPGIAILDDTVTRQIVDSGTVLPAQSCIDADHYDMSDFLPTAKSYYTIDGAIYPASLNLSGALLYYNKNHFRRAGLDAESAPRTLAEVRQFAERIKAAGVVDKPVVLQLSPALLEMFLTGSQVSMVDNDNGRGPGKTTQAVFANDPKTVELFEWIKEMIDAGLLDALPQTSGQIGHYLAMANQKSSMTIETSTAATSVEAFLKGDLRTGEIGGREIDASGIDLSALDIGAAPVPGQFEPGRLAMGGGAWYITNTTPPEVQAAAWDFIKFFNRTESQVQWNIEGSYLPYRMSAIRDPQLEDRWRNTLSGRWLAMAYDELINGIDPSFPGPLIGPYDQFRQALREAVDGLIFERTPPEEALQKAQSKATAAIKQYNDENF